MGMSKRRRPSRLRPQARRSGRCVHRPATPAAGPRPGRAPWRHAPARLPGRSATSLLLGSRSAPRRTRHGPAPARDGAWPLRPRPEIVRGFDPPATRFGAGHRGVDLLGHAGQAVHTSLGRHGHLRVAARGARRRRGRPRRHPHHLRAGHRQRARRRRGGPRRASSARCSARRATASPRLPALGPAARRHLPRSADSGRRRARSGCSRSTVAWPRPTVRLRRRLPHCAPAAAATPPAADGPLARGGDARLSV